MPPETELDPGLRRDDVTPAQAGAQSRLVSLDAFRGFTIAAMVLVNNPGDWGHLYAPLAHAPWHGWTFTDLIFPFFLFICGASMALSVQRRLGEGAEKGRLVLTLVKRGAIIFAIGLALNFVPSFDLATLRIPGVLQRIGLCVALAAPLAVHADWRGVLAAVVALFMASTGMMFSSGELEPGRDFGAAVDRAVLGTQHLWSQSRTWDPEGIVSTLPALGGLLLGLLAGRWLLLAREPLRRTAWLALAGALLAYAGLVLDAVLMPINKNLWTVSYAVFTTGLALVLFAVFHWLMDATGSPNTRERFRKLLLPFTIYGMNALFIFALASLVAKLLVFFKLKPVLYAPLQALPIAPVNASLLFAVLFDLAMLAVAWGMWKRRWFVKV